MRIKQSDAAGPISRGPRRWVAVIILSFLMLTATATWAPADDYDRSMAGHPLRIIAYILHPVGVMIDYLIMRPAHWLITQEPIQTLVGYED